MLGFVKRLFSSTDSMNKVVDGAMKGVGAVFYTEEEKATDRKEILKDVGKIIVDWVAASQGHRLARRLISVAITFMWLLLYFLAAVMSIVSTFVTNSAEIRASGKELFDMAISMNGAVMLILGFYFAAPYMGDIVQSAVTKFRSSGK